MKGFGSVASSSNKDGQLPFAKVAGDMIVTKEMLERFYELASPLVTQVWCHLVTLEAPGLLATDHTATLGMDADDDKDDDDTAAKTAAKTAGSGELVQVLVAVAVMSPEPFLCWARNGVKAKRRRRTSHRAGGGGGAAAAGATTAASAASAMNSGGGGSGRGLIALSMSSEARERVAKDFDEAADAYGLPPCYKVARLILEPEPFSTENALQTPLYQLCRGALQDHYRGALAALTAELRADCARAAKAAKVHAEAAAAAKAAVAKAVAGAGGGGAQDG